LFLIFSTHSAQRPGSSKWIKSNRQRVVTFSFTPQQYGLHEATLELTFYDGKRKVVFVIERTLRGVVTLLASDPTLSSDEGEEFLDVADTGISVSDENGFDFGIVERTDPNGPFASPTSSLTIRNAEGFPAVTLVQTKIRILHESGPGWVMTLAHCCLHSSAVPASSQLRVTLPTSSLGRRA
jgi:hypothetical protein